MLERVLADLILILHLAFILFSLLGGLLVLCSRLWLFLHLPAALWAVLISLKGWTCPLTPLENHFRHLADQTGYEGSFVEHYLLPLVYPAELSRDDQFFLALIALLVNLVVYGYVAWRVWFRA